MDTLEKYLEDSGIPKPFIQLGIIALMEALLKLEGGVKNERETG